MKMPARKMPIAISTPELGESRGARQDQRHEADRRRQRAEEDGLSQSLGPLRSPPRDDRCLRRAPVDSGPKIKIAKSTPRPIRIAQNPTVTMLS